MNDGPSDELDDDPFADLDEGVPSTERIEDPFEEIEPMDVDDEALWEAVMEDDLPTSSPMAADQLEETEGSDTVVRKEQYCKRCEHFTAPPECVCTYPESEIVEIVGVDRFRVRNCPVVARHASAKTVLPNED